MAQTRSQLSSDTRLSLVGKTGSGKTFVAKYLLRRVRRLMVLDPKGMLGSQHAPEWRLEEWSRQGERLLERGDRARLRIPAPLDGNWAPYLQYAWEIGNVTVYIDEVYGLVDPGAKPPRELSALYTRGREKHIGVFAATQRPAWVPGFILSEAEWLFMFRLKLPQDRHRMAELMGPEVETPIRDQYGFWMYNDQWENPEYVSKLQARKERIETAEMETVA